MGATGTRLRSTVGALRGRDRNATQKHRWSAPWARPERDSEAPLERPVGATGLTR